MPESLSRTSPEIPIGRSEKRESITNRAVGDYSAIREKTTGIFQRIADKERNDHANGLRELRKNLIGVWISPDEVDRELDTFVDGYREVTAVPPADWVTNGERPKPRTIEFSSPSSQESVDSKEVMERAMYANLAYARFSKKDSSVPVSVNNLEVTWAGLDIAGFDFGKFAIRSDGSMAALAKLPQNSDENRLMGHFNRIYAERKHSPERMLAQDPTMPDPNISDLLRLSIANEKEKIERTLARLNAPALFASADVGKLPIPNRKELERDIGDANRTIEFIRKNAPALTEALVALREDKKSDYAESLKTFQKEWSVNIIAHYPEEDDDDGSGFQCALFERNGKKTLAIAGTQLSDVKDLFADFSIFFGKLPESQSRSLAKFVQKHLKPEDSVSVVGHSLGWTLAQVATGMFWGDGWVVSETYTFNSPGAGKLRVPEVVKDDPFGELLKNFTKNRESGKIGETITNVKGAEWLSFIARKGKDIGHFEIRIATASHSIVAIIEVVRKMEEGKEKIVRMRINPGPELFRHEK